MLLAPSKICYGQYPESLRDWSIELFNRRIFSELDRHWQNNMTFNRSTSAVFSKYLREEKRRKVTHKKLPISLRSEQVPDIIRYFIEHKKSMWLLSYWIPTKTVEQTTEERGITIPRNWYKCYSTIRILQYIHQIEFNSHSIAFDIRFVVLWLRHLTGLFESTGWLIHPAKIQSSSSIMRRPQCGTRCFFFVDSIFVWFNVEWRCKKQHKNSIQRLHIFSFISFIVCLCLMAEIIDRAKDYDQKLDFNL